MATPAPSFRADRDAAILEAAAQEFLTRGYEGASLRAIIAASGASAGSVYRRFQSKEGLFRAVIADRMETGFRSALAITDAGRPIEQDLIEFGTLYLHQFLAPEALGLFRMMVAEATLIPETTKRLWEIGPAAAIQRLDSYLRQRAAAGEIALGDPHLAAAQFMDMIKGGLHLRLLLAGVRPDEREIRTSVEQAVSIFLGGIRTQNGAVPTTN